MKEILKQKNNELLHVFCRTGGITCSSVVDIIWYFFQLDFYLFMLIFTTRFRKLPCLKRMYCLTYFHFLIDVPQRKSDFSKITHIFLRVLSIYWNILTLKILASQVLEYLRLGQGGQFLENPGKSWKNKVVMESPGKSQILSKVLEKA